MPNPYHDETGKFCSKGQMKSAIHRVIKQGNLSMATALQEEYLEIEALSKKKNFLAGFATKSKDKKPAVYSAPVPAEIKVTKSELRKINRLPRDKHDMIKVNDLTREVVGYAPSYVNGFFTPKKEHVNVVGDLYIYVDPFKSGEHKIHVKDAPKLVERLWALND